MEADSASPYIEIDLAKIKHNARTLLSIFNKKNIEIMGVTKVVSGSPVLAKILTSAGIHFIADSRIENIKRMKKAGVQAEFVLIRTPFKSKLDQVIEYADISFNTEISIIEDLSKKALLKNKVHQIVLMLELGDLREGILEENIEEIFKSILPLKGINVKGIGTNLSCYGGVKPTAAKMKKLSDIALFLENRFRIKLDIISGGNSANFDWFFKTKDLNRINNIRLGEAIFLGNETLHSTPLDQLQQNVVTLVAEVIESNRKESIPDGELGQNAFGQSLTFTDNGEIARVILGIGRQEVDVKGLTPIRNMEIIGSSSDHTILDVADLDIDVGDRIRFNMNYSALLSSMSSPSIHKILINGEGT